MPAPYYLPAHYSTFVTVVPAATPTDLLAFNATSAKPQLRRLRIWGSQTVAGAYTFLVIQRSTLNAGPVINPPTTHAGVPYYSNMPASTVSIVNYIANPTSLGTAAATILTWPTIIPATASGNGLLLDVDFEDRPITLQGTQSICVNGNSVSFGAGIALVAQFDWDEGGADASA